MSDSTFSHQLSRSQLKTGTKSSAMVVEFWIDVGLAGEVTKMPPSALKKGPKFWSKKSFWTLLSEFGATHNRTGSVSTANFFQPMLRSPMARNTKKKVSHGHEAQK